MQSHVGGDDGTDEAGKRAAAVSDAHQNAGVPGGDVEMIHVETWGPGGTHSIAMMHCCFLNR